MTSSVGGRAFSKLPPSELFRLTYPFYPFWGDSFHAEMLPICLALTQFRRITFSLVCIIWSCLFIILACRVLPGFSQASYLRLNQLLEIIRAIHKDRDFSQARLVLRVFHQSPQSQFFLMMDSNLSMCPCISLNRHHLVMIIIMYVWITRRSVVSISDKGVTTTPTLLGKSVHTRGKAKHAQ